MKWIVAGCLVFALVSAFALTYVHGNACELWLRQVASSCHTHDEYLRTGWPLKWKAEPARLVDAQIEISYTFFALDTAVLFLIIGGGSLATVWYIWARPWERTAAS